MSVTRTTSRKYLLQDTVLFSPFPPDDLDVSVTSRAGAGAMPGYIEPSLTSNRLRMVDHKIKRWVSDLAATLTVDCLISA